MGALLRASVSPVTKPWRAAAQRNEHVLWAPGVFHVQVA